MATTKKKKNEPKAKSKGTDPFKLKTAEKPDPQVHVFGKGFVCDTDTRGKRTPKGRSPLEIVVDASEGFIPLWSKNTILRWRFRDDSLKAFANPAKAKTAIRKLFGDALLAWGDAAPVKFAEKNDAWDFEIVMRKTDNCDINGCVLASAFFPDTGRHKVTLFPQLFQQTKKEQVETLIHEIGHVFGLRHFFANISETEFPSEIFGTHKKFSIMNYGSDSVLTGDDKNDLKKLYKLVWSGELTEINGTPVKFVKPFHTIGTSSNGMVSLAEVQPVLKTQSRDALITIS